VPTAGDIEPITNAIWSQIGALVCLGGALVAIGRSLNWARIYPWT